MTSRTIISGPCIVKVGANWYETSDDVIVTPNTATRIITSSLRGPVTRRVIDRTVTVAFTPLGRLTALAAYYPYGPADLGSLIAPAVDQSIIIWGADSKQYTYAAAIMTSPPELILSAKSGPFGSMEFTAMGSLTKNTAAANSMFTSATAAIDGYDYDVSDILTPGYKLELLDASDTVQETIDGKEGFNFNAGYTLNPLSVDAYGTVNYRLSALDPALTFAPAGPDEAKLYELLRFQGADAAKIGEANNIGLKARVSPVTGSGVILTFPDCQLTAASLIYGREAERLGPWTLNPVVDADAETLFTLALTTPAA